MDNDKFLGHTSSIEDMRMRTIIHPAIITAPPVRSRASPNSTVGPAYSTSLEKVNVIA